MTPLGQIITYGLNTTLLYTLKWVFLQQCRMFRSLIRTACNDWDYKMEWMLIKTWKQRCFVVFLHSQNWSCSFSIAQLSLNYDTCESFNTQVFDFKINAHDFTLLPIHIKPKYKTWWIKNSKDKNSNLKLKITFFL